MRTTGRRGFSMPTFSEEAQRTPHGKRDTWSGNLRILFYKQFYIVKLEDTCEQLSQTFFYLPKQNMKTNSHFYHISL